MFHGEQLNPEWRSYLAGQGLPERGLELRTPILGLQYPTASRCLCYLVHRSAVKQQKVFCHIRIRAAITWLGRNQPT